MEQRRQPIRSKDGTVGAGTLDSTLSDKGSILILPAERDLSTSSQAWA